VAGIWVRSQNKKCLINARCFWVVPCGQWDLPNNEAEGKFKVLAVLENDYEVIGGIYSTEARALQVLDDIQAHIKEHENNLLYNLAMAGKVQYDSTWPVFEMPAE
jgi:hypothetical protein